MVEVQVAFGIQASLPELTTTVENPVVLRIFAYHTVFTCEVYSVHYLIDCFACACFSRCHLYISEILPYSMYYVSIDLNCVLWHAHRCAKCIVNALNWQHAFHISSLRCHFMLYIYTVYCMHG